MAAARFTITANLVDLIGPGADWRKAVAVVTTNLGAGAGVAGAGGELGLGDGRVTVAQDGSLSASVVDPNDASLNVTGFAYTLHVSVPVAASMVRGRGAVRQTYSFGPFVPDASGPITTWRNQFDTPAVDPVWRDGFRAEMEDIRDEVAAIVDGFDPGGGGGGGDIPPEVTWDVDGTPGLHVSGEAGHEAWVTADTISVGLPDGGLATLSPGVMFTARSGHDETTGVTYSSAAAEGGGSAGAVLFLSTDAWDAETSWSGSLILTHPVDGESFLRAPVEGAEEAPATIATREWVETVTVPAPPTGGLVPLRIRSDVASPYAYIGTAPVGTADADTGWLVSRIHLTAHETQTATGAWDDRAVLPYES